MRLKNNGTSSMPQSKENPFRVDRNPFRNQDIEIQTSPGLGWAMLKEGARRLGDTVLETPRIAGDTLAGLASAPDLIHGLVPGGQGPIDEFKNAFTAEQNKFPASFLRSFNDDKGIDLPNVNQAIAGAKSIPSLMPGGESPGDAYSRNLDSLNQGQAVNELSFPVGTGAAKLAADVGTMFMTKKPFAKGIINSERSLMEAVKTLATTPGFKQGMKETLRSTGMKHLYRGAGRSIEAGAEATMLEIINGDNPVESAALAAGLQGGGSLLLHALTGTGSKSLGSVGLRIAAASVGTGSIWQLMKDVVPGGDDNLLNSMTTGYEKVMLAVVLGVASGAVGAGRLRGASEGWQKNLPQTMDALNTIHRGTFLGLMLRAKDGTPEEQALIDNTLNLMTNNPDKIPDSIRTQLFDSIQQGGFVQTVDALSSNEGFKKLLFAQKPSTFMLPSFVPPRK